MVLVSYSDSSEDAEKNYISMIRVYVVTDGFDPEKAKDAALRPYEDKFNVKSCGAVYLTHVTGNSKTIII